MGIWDDASSINSARSAQANAAVSAAEAGRARAHEFAKEMKRLGVGPSSHRLVSTNRYIKVPRGQRHVTGWIVPSLYGSLGSGPKPYRFATIVTPDGVAVPVGQYPRPGKLFGTKFELKESDAGISAEGAAHALACAMRGEVVTTKDLPAYIET
ncbi:MULTISPECIES: hypothetical protein [unclassified Gordonia (in: high G+C Gram-positive bacteria)]|uniref:hypothetical protein n=1 Tax=unclassified Gordonia (in: high G+C Gram-positive bacteria) TaxID=2657482 RepID=UPI000815DB77|nr:MULTISPECIES: hypothetical protein [unclassified Gordonia (in: high G+C Gram-positive bacteria)]SCB86596.1 hypothetical protein GA0061091_102224 [Gordonia sp. v-85]